MGLPVSTEKKYFTSWRNFASWCHACGLDAFSADSRDFGAYLVEMADLTASANSTEAAYYAIRFIRLNAGCPLVEQVPFLKWVRQGIQKAADPKELERYGFEPN